jgi:hypothetical protein
LLPLFSYVVEGEKCVKGTCGGGVGGSHGGVEHGAVVLLRGGRSRGLGLLCDGRGLRLSGGGGESQGPFLRLCGRLRVRVLGCGLRRQLGLNYGRNVVFRQGRKR